ncbi:hypothetical protein AAES_147993 [Amazona aestiva]|uniref:Myb/SANT-like DNA-binding domain-containing protein n=1 Tax=Amazona aestiva TaxID=12930 RepID=A0A0Q3UQH4_AMAAE|nr:hypothetical protein AAES_147993 [Amazona aestiva]
MAAAGGGGGGARRGLLKRKPNFTLQEIEILMSEVLKYEQLLFGAAASTVNAYEKQKIWWRITNKINAAGRNQRDIGEVKNRWRGLRRRANDKITRHRQERQGPAGRAPPPPRPGTGTGTGPGPPELGPGPASGWGQRGGAGIEPPVLSAEVVPHGGCGGTGTGGTKGCGGRNVDTGERDWAGMGMGRTGMWRQETAHWERDGSAEGQQQGHGDLDEFLG